MKYDAVRNDLKDGQVVFFNAVTWPQKIISIFTRGPFSHVGMLVWMTDSTGTRKLMCIESSFGGARIVQLRSYLPRGMTVVDVGLDWAKCAERALNDTGSLHYNIPNLALIGIKSILSQLGLKQLAKKVKPMKGGEVCSEFVATLLEEHGYPLDSFTSPNELYRMLLNLPSFVKCTTIDPEAAVTGHK